MLEAEALGSLVQFGTAGLMGWMWLTERRTASARERQLDEAHARVSEQRVAIDALLAAVRDNTRVLGQLEAGLEAGQRTLLALLAKSQACEGAVAAASSVSPPPPSQNHDTNPNQAATSGLPARSRHGAGPAQRAG